jgi:hypothetical protein
LDRRTQESLNRRRLNPFVLGARAKTTFREQSDILVLIDRDMGPCQQANAAERSESMTSRTRPTFTLASTRAQGNSRGSRNMTSTTRSGGPFPINLACSNHPSEIHAAEATANFSVPVVTTRISFHFLA